MKQVKILSSAALGVTLLLSSSAYAGAEVYGHVNRAFMNVSDGHQKAGYSVDGDTSASRLGTKVEMKSECFTAGGVTEFELESASSSAVTQNNRATAKNNVSIRHVYAYLKNDFGKLTVGRGSTATDGVAEITLNGANVMLYNDVKMWGGGHRFHKQGDAGAVVAADPTVSSVFSNLDGFGRANMVRYDTPSFNGFSLALSHSSKDTDTEADSREQNDIALRYKGDLKEFTVNGALGWGRQSQSYATERLSQWAGSLAMLHNDTGFNVTLAAGRQKTETGGARKKPKYYYVGLGKQCDINAWGMTNFALDYYTGKNFGENDDKSRAYGLGIVQHVNAVNTELYAGGRNFRYKKTTQKYDKMWVYVAGLRMKFSIA